MSRRAILNFSHKCAFKCEWCYVPFEAPKASLDVVLNIIESLSRLGFNSITIGGGDPFQYKFISIVLEAARSSGLFVHVDTHAKSLRLSDHTLSVIEKNVDLIGLPLDGPTAYIHDDMRSMKGHFDILLNCIDWLSSINKKIKINTMVSKKNVDYLGEMSPLIESVFPSRWSIYQFWPLGPASIVENKHALDDLLFMESANLVSNSMCSVKVEINSKESRRDTYPIVQHDGLVFVHESYPKNRFLKIGSIFDHDILYKIDGYCNNERRVAVSRYI